MLNNAILMACLVAGFLFGFFTKFSNSKVHGRILLVNILLLLFFMGAILGFAPDLPGRIKGYGINALVIVICACAGSVGFTAILVKVFKRC
ncbi:MAG: LysO family transporter [Deferribacteraceae bacterium]|jgi:uncharacterized membrane protein YbjE (DUF340 family)|nr:LysO family transporter [Deferribacteraceae bacterium]